MVKNMRVIPFECQVAAFTRIFLSTFEYAQFEGTLDGGRFFTLCSAPKQSENMCTDPARLGFISLIANMIRWMAIGPTNSPL